MWKLIGQSKSLVLCPKMNTTYNWFEILPDYSLCSHHSHAYRWSSLNLIQNMHMFPLTMATVPLHHSVIAPLFRCIQLVPVKLCHHKEHPKSKSIHPIEYSFLLGGKRWKNITFALALLKNTPSEKRPSVTPPMSPFNVRVACRMPPNCSTTKTNRNDKTP